MVRIAPAGIVTIHDKIILPIEPRSKWETPFASLHFGSKFWLLFWVLLAPLWASILGPFFIFYCVGFPNDVWNHFGPSWRRHLTSSWEASGTLKLDWFSVPFLLPFFGHFGSPCARQFGAFFRAFVEAFLGGIFRVCWRGLEARFRRPRQWKWRFVGGPPGLLQLKWDTFLN